MAQSNISISNKTGYSMFWSSMWDNKNSYSRNFKEDIFLKQFFKLAFNDSVSIKTIILKNKNKFFYKSYTQYLDVNKKNFNKYYMNYNKLNSHISKIWILKYQKWVIIYNFVFINNFTSNSVINFKPSFENIYNSNFYNAYKNYIKAESFNKYNYSFKKSFKKNIVF